MGNDGQCFATCNARLGSAKRQKTFLRPFTVRLPLFSAETMNASHFGLGLSGLVRNFFSAPFHKVTLSTLELDMRTRSQPWRVADFLRQDTCPGNVSHAFLLLEKSDICFVLYSVRQEHLNEKVDKTLGSGEGYFLSILSKFLVWAKSYSHLSLQYILLQIIIIHIDDQY